MYRSIYYSFDQYINVSFNIYSIDQYINVSINIFMYRSKFCSINMTLIILYHISEVVGCYKTTKSGHKWLKMTKIGKH